MPKKDNHGGHQQNYDAATGKWTSGKTINEPKEKYEGTKGVEYNKPQERKVEVEEEKKERKGTMEKELELPRQKEAKVNNNEDKLELILKKYGIEEAKILAILNELKGVNEEKANTEQEASEKDDVEEEYNAEEMVKRILGKDFKLEKDTKLQDLVKRKYGKLL